MHVADLCADRPVTRLDLIVLRRYPRRMVVGEKFTGPMAAACARDNTGVVGLVLWGEDVDRVTPGTSIRLLRGWCRERDGSLVVSTGRHGRLVVLDHVAVPEQA
jgi:ssDNA-binding replication factor A large subunit